MATAIFGKGAAYDVRPAGEHAVGLSGPIGGLIGMIKDALQGACSGLLSLLGATHMTGTPGGLGTLHSEIDVLDGIWQSISAGGLAGPVELLGGIALFFAARRTISRTAGLLAFIAFIAAYSNGYSVNDMLTVLANLLEGAAGALQSIPTAETA